ncbi:MAG: tetratricopeptide repeat protein [Kiritimatiellae bacterium]|nr:tetratricopeptide repeat protein [Kiritimatiellia bacterium]
MRRLSAIFCVLAALAASGEDELSIAREALRDGLFEIAVAHARRVPGAEASLIEAECLARRGKWSELAAFASEPAGAECEELAYYRALALFETGDLENSRLAIEGIDFADPAHAQLARRLKSRIALRLDGAPAALEILGSGTENEGDFETKMQVASLLAATGDAAGASNFWYEVAHGGTNVDERVRIVAAANLGDTGILKDLHVGADSAAARRSAGLWLGRLLMESAATYDDGASIVRALVRDAPDAEDAKESFGAIASSAVALGRYKEALDVYAEMIAAWPDSVKSCAMNSGRGVAFAMTGKTTEALEAFAKAEELAESADAKAVNAVRRGDALSSAGENDRAMDEYRRAIEKYPDAPASRKAAELLAHREREKRGRQLYREYRFDEAQEIFEAMAAEDPSQKDRMEYLAALCCYGRGLDGEAERRMTALRSAAVAPGMRAEATLWLARYDFNCRRWQEAADMFLASAGLESGTGRAPESMLWAAKAWFSGGDFGKTIQTTTALAEKYPASPCCGEGLILQAEALVETARFDEAILVLDRALLCDGLTRERAVFANLLRADALFGMGADNPELYRRALESYMGLRNDETTDAGRRILISFRIARTLEKLKRMDEAIEGYYVDVVLAYRDGAARGERFDDDVRSAFSRAAFRLAEEFAGRGNDFQAISVLELVKTSDAPAATEAAKRIERLKRKGDVP